MVWSSATAHMLHWRVSFLVAAATLDTYNQANAAQLIRKGQKAHKKHPLLAITVLKREQQRMWHLSLAEECGTLHTINALVFGTPRTRAPRNCFTPAFPRQGIWAAAAARPLKKAHMHAYVHHSADQQNWCEVTSALKLVRGDTPRVVLMEMLAT
ncbi:hypothetical protein TRVL_09030 [Trypanosoma vivax]|nr:hypothetical protein TRVL_09030 [Trypanosoma vivax]